MTIKEFLSRSDIGEKEKRIIKSFFEIAQKIRNLTTKKRQKKPKYLRLKSVFKR